MDKDREVIEIKGEFFDVLIRQEIEKFRHKNNESPKYLVLDTQGSFLLRSYLGLEDVIELPRTYRKMEVLFSPSQDADTVRVI